MQNNLTPGAIRVMALADARARQLNHGYIGTEHILLGLLDEQSTGISEMLRALGATPEQVHEQIERLVSGGPTPVTASQLPLTPRARRVIDYAAAEVQIMGQKLVGPEHLLLGLFRQPDGVAGQVLRNLGVNLNELRVEAFKTLMAQMKIVEAAVRPLRTSVPRKRKMREELLAHLSSIYEQELARLNNPAAAMDEAARRFGDPGDLSRDLQASLSINDRIGYAFQRLFGWRAPESVARYMLRQALLSLGIIVLAVAVAFVAIVVPTPGGEGNRSGISQLLIALLALPLVQFLLGLCYYRIRDSFFGAFGSPRSTWRAWCYAFLIALTVAFFGAAFMWLARPDVSQSIDLRVPLLGGIVVAAFHMLMARWRGASEIRDTIWEFVKVQPDET
jgi:ATP-dependent Clp protease ATP-binding subunit ClpC